MFKASAENFIAIKISGFCARFMENLMLFMTSTSHGKSNRAAASFVRCLPSFSSFDFPCQSHEYSESAVCTLCVKNKTDTKKKTKQRNRDFLMLLLLLRNSLHFRIMENETHFEHTKQIQKIRLIHQTICPLKREIAWKSMQQQQQQKFRSIFTYVHNDIVAFPAQYK